MLPKKEHELVDGVVIKYCSKCDTWKPLSDFYQDKYCWDGYSQRCITCLKKEHREYYEKNKEQILEKRKEYYKRKKKNGQKKRT